MSDRRRGRRSRQPDPADAPLAQPSSDDPTAAADDGAATKPLETSGEAGEAFALDGLAIAGITRRRAGWIAAGAFTIWIVLVFARQVGDASAKSSEVDQRRAENASLQTEIAALQQELVLIQKQAYISQQAHAYRLGDERDRPFTLSPDAPPLSAISPGSAAVRLGAVRQTRSPLESWLSILFGPDR
jgi:cell division protein FtsB